MVCGNFLVVMVAVFCIKRSHCEFQTLDGPPATAINCGWSRVTHSFYNFLSCIVLTNRSLTAIGGCRGAHEKFLKNLKIFSWAVGTTTNLSWVPVSLNDAAQKVVEQMCYSRSPASYRRKIRWTSKKNADSFCRGWFVKEISKPWYIKVVTICTKDQII